MNPYTFLANLSDLLPEIPADSIISRAIYTDDRLRAVLFGFAAGQELSEHTASQPAILHILQGEVDLTLGDDSVQAQAGAWVHMPAQLPHSIMAKTPATMLLLLIKTGMQQDRDDPSG